MIWVACSPPSTVGKGVAFGSSSTYAFRNGSDSSVSYAFRSLVRLGRMPSDMSTSAMAEAPDLPPSTMFCDSGPFSQARNSHAASCLAWVAFALTMVSHEYEMADGFEPEGPTG